MKLQEQLARFVFRAVLVNIRGLFEGMRKNLLNNFEILD